MGMRILVLSIVPLFVACGSMEAHRVKSSDVVSGLRVQAAEPHAVVAVMRGSDGVPTTKYAEMALPSQGEQYEVNFTGALFTAREIAVELNDAGTLKKYSFTTDSNVDEAFKNAAGVAGSVAAIRKERKSLETDPLADDNADLRVQIENDMLRANQTAAEAGAELPYPFLFGGK